jgi:pimeloyl-ACP methyl ester carboxylesterase
VLTPALLVTALVATPCRGEALERHEHRISGGAAGVKLFVMEVRAPAKRRGAVVFMHGAGSGGSAIWDLRHRDYSMMRYLACKGFDTYAFDARGFGGSTMPAALSAPADKNPPVVRAADAVEDMAAVVAHARRRSRVKRVDLMAWSWGCVVSGLFAGAHAEHVRRLVLYAPVYDRKRPRRHKTEGAWRSANKTKILAYHDDNREELEVWVEHIDAMFRFAGGDTLRLPNGPYRDIYGPDAPIWDASKVRAPTLIVRGDRDPASLTPHVLQLFEALTGAAERRVVIIGGADHYLPRERRYAQLQRVAAEFLEAPQLHVAPGHPSSKRDTSKR